jgi:hypothetical protein
MGIFAALAARCARLAQGLQTSPEGSLVGRLEGWASRMDRDLQMSAVKVEDRVRRARATWLVAALCAAWPLLLAGSASAGERNPGCDGFCEPLATRQLDMQRGQGFETSVILWDELNRRQSAPPPPPTGNQGATDSTTVRMGPVAPPMVVLTGAGR